jgi:hypothetical protein
MSPPTKSVAEKANRANPKPGPSKKPSCKEEADQLAIIGSGMSSDLVGWIANEILSAGPEEDLKVRFHHHIFATNLLINLAHKVVSQTAV